MGLREEWLEALNDLDQEDDNLDAVTTGQLAELWGCSITTARRKVSKLVKLDKAIVVRKRTKTGVYTAYLLSSFTKKSK